MKDEINKIDNSTIIIKIGDVEEVRKAIETQKQEIDRLNNIINELEKFFKYAYDNEVKPLNDRKISVWTICLDKLKELKENK